MVEVKALHSFQHNGSSFKRGQVWDERESQAEALRKAGLVTYRDNKADPQQGTGAKSSASPAAPASPKQTSSKSARGAKKKQAARSSSPTPASE